MIKELFTADIPQYAVCYLEYGDDSGLEPDDIANIDEWLNSIEGGPLTFDWGEENEFTPFPEFGLACSTINCTVYGQV